MRQIKFRGTAATDGRMVTGTGAYVTGDFACVIHCMIYVHCKPDTIQQLIGVDKNGKEVYEGDLISGQRRASFEDFSAINSGRAVLLEE